MKKILYILLACSGLLFAGCEEVIDVDLATGTKRLVVDASINWVKGTPGNEQIIKLTTTTGYYDAEIPVATGATVTVVNSTGTLYEFTEVPGTGQYVCQYFVPQINEAYTLTIIYNGQTYTGSETLYDVPDITSITQSEDGGFEGDETEIRFFFNDNAAEENYYLSRFDAEFLTIPEYGVNEDRFTNGNEMFDFISDEDVEPQDVIDIKLYGISKQYYNYMAKLLEVAGGGGGGPFTTPPATVRGNVVNQTDEANYPLGYFRLSRVSAVSYEVQPTE
ncbi:DUF4249 domain-containing protein [Flavobacterium sp. RHBU_24]|uniref:DUF4249 domain-containing protein n=1 Tax=Flavobacterium sp. RHBU_24 TaxID=3391185 RepID=UPI003984CC3B